VHLVRSAAEQKASIGPGKGIIHAYTQLEGDLSTPQQKQQAQRSQLVPQVQPGMMLAAGTNPLSLGRLIEVLLEKSILDAPEALYIAGYGSKPSPASGYLDPAKMTGGN
jgi:hypothetical protein